MQQLRKRQREEKYGVSSDSGTHRNWSDLPDLPLDSILHGLSLIPDVLSFSFVCRSWRSLYSASRLSSLPPLMLHPQLLPTSYPTDRPHWSHPPRCSLKALFLRTRMPRSPVPSETLTLSCLGYSRGHLVFHSPPNLLLVDVFTGQQTRIPSPPVESLCPRLALLTDSDLILACNSRILSYRPWTNTWSVLENIYAASLLVFQGEVLCLHTLFSNGDARNIQLGVLELTGTSISFRQTKIYLRWFPLLAMGPTHICQRFSLRLVECGKELFLLRFVYLQKTVGMRKFDVFKVDVDRSTWVKVESIGDWCLFVDSVGSHAIGCPEPASWGGKSNCAYIARPQYDGLVVVPIDEEDYDPLEEKEINMFQVDEGVGFRQQNENLPRWPSPVWVYPGMFIQQM